MGYYHQDERDDAVGFGCALVLVAMMFVLAAIFASLVAGFYCPDPTSNTSDAKPITEAMDGSNAGANAVTLEELEAQGIL